jgi:hypothetical protein
MNVGPGDEVELVLDPYPGRLFQGKVAIQNEERLGGMGVPVKVLVKDQPVFLCCKSCRKEALADPDKTLAKVKGLKAKPARQPEE